MTQHITDIAIIGAGPVGLFSVFQAGMLKMKCHVIDTLESVGGQCTALYPEKPIYDIPAHPSILAQELINRLEEQAAPFHPVYHLNQQVTALEHADGGFVLTTSTGTSIAAKAVILAAGCGAFGPNRPPLDKIEIFEGKSVFYMVQRREQFRDKHIVIAGGGDSAVDWAISLQEIAKSVSIIHRRPKFKAAPESVDRLHKLVEQGKIKLEVPYQLAGLQGTNGYLSHVNIATLDGQSKSIEADILLPFFGLAMELGPITHWGLNLDYNHVSVDPITMQTSMPGVFAVGDIAKYTGKLKLILSGFAEAATACHAIYPLINPGQALHFEYSTTKGVTVI